MAQTIVEKIMHRSKWSVATIFINTNLLKNICCVLDHQFWIGLVTGVSALAIISIIIVAILIVKLGKKSLEGSTEKTANPKESNDYSSLGASTSSNYTSLDFRKSGNMPEREPEVTETGIYETTPDVSEKPKHLYGNIND